MQIIAQFIATVLFSLNTTVTLPVNAGAPEEICGKSAIAADSQCELLTGDACTAACDATDWVAHCESQCCDNGECDQKCASACEYNSWGDCTFNWCGANALFCDGQPKATNGELDACLDYLCESDYEVEGLVCGGGQMKLPRKTVGKQRF
jgi:hypothetical protein